MHRLGVGVGLHVALSSSLPTAQEGEEVLAGGEEGFDFHLLEES